MVGYRSCLADLPQTCTHNTGRHRQGHSQSRGMCHIFKLSNNIFDSLPALTPPKPADLHDELDHYFITDPEQVTDVLMWWHECHASFPCLSRMALNYLSIPGMYSAFLLVDEQS
jgi:hypothetical protein